MDSSATREKMLDAIADFHVSGATDKKAGVIASFVKWPEMGIDAFLGNIFYAQTVPAGAPPPAAVAGLLAVTGAAGLGTKTLGEIVVSTGAGATKGTSRYIYIQQKKTHTHTHTEIILLLAHYYYYSHGPRLATAH